jgi:serine beta-lactamase-like protein LACTB
MLSTVISQARTIIQTEMLAKVPGLSVAVSVGGTLVWSEQWGYANLGNLTPVKSETRFRIGSVSKPLTAAGLALLVERDQLDLDAPVQKYIPDFPKKGAAITTRLLAGHLSGIRNYRGNEAVSNQPFPNLRAGLKIFENDPLESTPGSKFSYSSYNWNVLGAVMEAAANQSFLNYLKDNVISPLGLTNTGPEHSKLADPQRSHCYEIHPKSGKFVEVPELDYSSKWPSGGYLSTAEDLVRFGSAHLQPGFLKRDSLQLLFTPQATDAGVQTGYGVGWFVDPNVLYHGGDALGGISLVLLVPACRIVIAITTNGGQGLLRNSIRSGRATEEAARVLFNKETIAHRIAKQFEPL